MSRTLRPKKSINYLEVVRDTSSLNSPEHISTRKSMITRMNSNTSTQSIQEAVEAKTFEHESDDQVSSDNNNENETDSEEDGYSSKKKKRKLTLTSKQPAEYLALDDDDYEDEFKLQREKNMRDRQNILKTMALDDEKNELGVKTVASPIRGPVIPAKKKKTRRSQNFISNKPRKSVDYASLRKSLRIATRDSIISDANYENNLTTNGAGQDEPTQLIEEDLDLVSNDADKDFFENLKELPNVLFNSITNFVSCEYEEFSDIIKSCQMYQEPTKIIPSRVTSLDFHRSEDKFLLICGDKHGHVSLWSIGMNKGITLKPHSYSTNCVSFSNDGLRFYSTALDGTTRVGDIEQKNSTLLYKSVSGEGGDESHTTWHHEFGQQLMIARGNGSVKFLDLRAPSEDAPVYKCHKRSVRTVQVNPATDNYFLTSSGVGEFGIFDLRQIGSKQSPIILENLGKSLTSAFYSAKGSYVLTTSNDDTIRVYDCRNNSAKEHVRIPHNNHCGRWLSVFKARWQPQREDCFYVGSLLAKPKRIQSYTIDGMILHEFHSPMMETHCPVLTVHPTKPIIVGGNASGRIHVYSPFRDLQDQIL